MPSVSTTSGPARLDTWRREGNTSGQRALGRLLSAARESTPTQSVRDLVTEPSSGLVFSGLQAYREEGFMPRQITPTTTLENLKREAKRWLKALRTNTDAA